MVPTPVEKCLGVLTLVLSLAPQDAKNLPAKIVHGKGQNIKKQRLNRMKARFEMLQKNLNL